MTLAAPALILIGALALAGCGRRGPLEEPPRARAQTAAQPAQGAADPSQGVVLGAPSFGGSRQTATTDNAVEGFGVPAMRLPGLPPDNIATATDPTVANPAAPQTISSATTSTSTGGRSPRRSAPPDRAFLLDPLL
jgi:predicted small lipoprotein YifL